MIIKRITSINSFIIMAWALFMLGPYQAQAFQDQKPNILIITTGGTIASRTNAPMVEGHALVQAVPELLDFANITVEEFSKVGSSQITPDHWLRLAKRINTLFAEEKAPDGIVITHGTDTMEETAYFLNLTVKSDKPVIITGSMRSSNEVSADGSANLINAVRVATHKGTKGKGVLLALSENITSARDAIKTDNRRVDTFEGGNVGHIGTVDPDGVRFYHQPLQPHTTATEFDIQELGSLPKVPILSDYSGFDKNMLKAISTQEMDGLVIRTFAGGRMSRGMREGLTEFQGKGIPVVISTRVPKGRIVSQPNYSFPAVFANGQYDNKARILLMLALTQTSELSEIQKIFDTY